MLSFIMRNEDIAKAMQKLESSFKQHADGQLAKFTTLLERYMETTESHLAKLIPIRAKNEEKMHDGPPRGSTDPAGIFNILKTLRINVPQFDGHDVEDWICKIDKLFGLHCLPTATRLTLVAFHLDGKALTWFQWMEKAEGLPSWEAFIEELRK